MEKISLDSGFGYNLEYPLESEVGIFCTLKKDDNDRYVVMEYLPHYPFRKVLQSQIHTIEDHAKDFLLSQLSDIEAGKYDKTSPLLIELYGTEKPSA
ncbi:hypothetical protein MUO14_12860 [Halobacillus shinanisalinarum]|uniref:Uncharacterized protein n=1 Tax=Halobacillus shinanisalinarum TaxID=2932258 RepID=A0ABY4GUT7_9BACI|nr:hypothetical protein [Halobacillus shinanisalinarum]UOQ91475.1 hypothetical protein MUO14_12860 [Halobacillus shinanisalinarum]